MDETLETMLPTGVIERLLAEALAQGGDFAEVYCERTRTNHVALEEQKVRTAAYRVDLGVGIRVFSGTEVGYAYSDDLSTTALLQTARVAGSIACSGARNGARAAPQPVRVQPKARPDRYRVAKVPDDVPAKAKAELLLRADRAARAHDPRISQVMGAFVDQSKDLLVATSAGGITSDRQVMCRLHVTAVATNDTGERRTGMFGGGGRVPFDHYRDFSPETVARESARMAVAQLGAVEAPAGPQTVVLSPGWSGVLLHEAVGHGLEADFIREGTSLYAGRLGELVASPLCTVIDNGELPYRRGTINIDDEGQVAQEKVLIENGRLCGYMVDRLSAQIMGIAATGSGRRESYRYPPMPRMTNTYLAAGPHEHEEIVRSVHKGLYCAAIGGGQVDISNGNFVFEVREGYLIEGGRITAPVKNATLIGVGPEVLKKVSMVGNDPALDPGIGTCSKDGQSIPVGVGLPTVRIDDITVGGTHVGA